MKKTSFAIKYNSLQITKNTNSFLFNSFSEIKNATFSYKWNHSLKNVKSLSNNFSYSSFSNLFQVYNSYLYNSNKIIDIDMGRDISIPVLSKINPFKDTKIIDKFNSSKSAFYRIQSNSWIEIQFDSIKELNEKIKEIEFTFNKIGDIPAQIKVINNSKEVFYSKNKFFSVKEDSFVNLQSFHTLSSQCENEFDDLGGFNSDVKINENSIITSSVDSFSNEIEVQDVSDFPENGYVIIDSEIISYNYKKNEYPFKLKGCFRGALNTISNEHLKNAKISLIKNESLFNNVSFENEDVVYKCVSIVNKSSFFINDLSFYFPTFLNNKDFKFAIERSEKEQTLFSQNIFDNNFSPYIPEKRAEEIDFSIDKMIFNNKLNEEFVDSFGYIIKDNIESDGDYVFLASGKNKGTIIYRFLEDSIKLIEKIIYNSSSKNNSFIKFSYRYSNSLKDIYEEPWIDFNEDPKHILTDIVKNIRVKAVVLDIKIDMGRSLPTISSPSFGNLRYIIWNNAFSFNTEFDNEFIDRSMSKNNFYFEDFCSELTLLSSIDQGDDNEILLENDNYVIDSTLNIDFKPTTLPIKIFDSFVYSFVSKQDVVLNKLNILEKRFDWDSTDTSSIDLKLNALILDDLPENDSNVIGSSIINVGNLTSKIESSSLRQFDFNNTFLNKGQKYWVYLWAETNPKVKAEWRLKGSDLDLINDPFNNSSFLYKNGLSKSKESKFKPFYSAVGKINNILSSNINEKTFTYFSLIPNENEKDEWFFESIKIGYNQPFYNDYNIGPFIIASWKKTNEDFWHNFRPRRLNMSFGEQELKTSSRYNRIPKGEYVIIRFEIKPITLEKESSSIFIEGIGSQPAINKVCAFWKQKSIKNKNIISTWIDPIFDKASAIKFSDIYDKWRDNLRPYEKFFIWFKKDNSKNNSPERNLNFSVSFMHSFNRSLKKEKFNDNNFKQLPPESTLPSTPSFINVPKENFTGTYLIEWEKINNATTYILEEESSPFKQIAITSSNGHIVKNKNIGNYRYRVKSVNSLGESDYIISNIVKVLNIESLNKSSSSDLSSYSSLSASLSSSSELSSSSSELSSSSSELSSSSSTSSLGFSSSSSTSSLEFSSSISFNPGDFISEWQTDNSGTSNNNQIMLPLESSGNYNFVVNWGDGNQDTITTWDQPETTHTYATSGTYTVTISGTIEGFRFANSGDKEKILDIKQWGDLILGSNDDYFNGCSNLDVTATDTPDLSSMNNARRFFLNCSSLVGNSSFNNWDVSNIVNISLMFKGAGLFNQPLNDWDVSSVIKMVEVFESATSFNQPLDNWNVVSVDDMEGMFQNATSFNASIDGWNASSVFRMRSMFKNASSFNQPINNWNVSNVSNFIAMFKNATSFNQPLNNWNIPSATNMFKMFHGASNFDQDLSNWNITNVNNMGDMFAGIALSTSNYDAILDINTGWPAKNPQNNVALNAGTSKYTASGDAETGRDDLINNHSWTISDGGSI